MARNCGVPILGKEKKECFGKEKAMRTRIRIPDAARLDTERKKRKVSVWQRLLHGVGFRWFICRLLLVTSAQVNAIHIHKHIIVKRHAAALGGLTLHTAHQLVVDHHAWSD